MSAQLSSALNITLLANSSDEAAFFGGQSEETIRHESETTTKSDSHDLVGIGMIMILVLNIFAFVQTTPNMDGVDAGINSYTEFIVKHAPGN